MTDPEQPYRFSIADVVTRTVPPEPWAEGEKIPWNDPEFSRRMLTEHLSQEHGMASRQGAVIDDHVAWLHQYVLAGRTSFPARLPDRPARILDLACGPGLYASRLAKLGHQCTGIDFGPASIEYAREAAQRDELSCWYIEGDLRTTDFAPFDEDLFLECEADDLASAGDDRRYGCVPGLDALHTGGLVGR